MAQIGCLLWAIFFAIIAYSMMPGYMTFVIIVSAIAGFLDAHQKNKKKEKKKKEMEERERQKRREKWSRIANGKNPNDDFDPVY
jgi:flagellar biosynthesis component FlhA